MRLAVSVWPARLPLIILRLILGGVFIDAGVWKITAPLTFADGIAAYRIVPEALVNVLALSLPPFEIMLGVWLIFGWRPRSAAFCAACTLGVFLAAIGSAQVRGLHVDCACFGPVATSGPAANGSMALLRDALLTAAALVLYVFAWRESRLRGAPSGFGDRV